VHSDGFAFISHFQSPISFYLILPRWDIKKKSKYFASSKI